MTRKAKSLTLEFMKRWIVILTLTAFGFIPTCGVFAMNPSVAMPDEPCAYMGALMEIHDEAIVSIHAPEPVLACCEHRDTSPDSTQALIAFQIQSPAIHATSFDAAIEQTVPYVSVHNSHIDHPPDDFERLSQAKRE